MRAHEVSFLDLVQGEKQFQVPLYQRTYSWGSKQLAQLWRDLLEQGREMANGAAAGTHFMGSVVITPSPTLQAAGVNRWLLVDGAGPLYVRARADRLPNVIHAAQRALGNGQALS